MSQNTTAFIYGIYDQAVDLPPEEQAAFVAEACKGDQDLIERVMAMVHQFDAVQDSDFDDQIQDRIGQLAQAALAGAKAAKQLAPGRRLGSYLINREIGKGGMGVVYEATHQRLKKKIALKVLPADLAANPKHIERFKREGRLLASIEHPNIVSAHDIDEVDGIWFLAMEFVDGQSLQIPENGFDLPTFFKLAGPLCDALHAAHENGVIHRDLKPSNIVIGNNGRLKVLDFGIASLQPKKDGGDSLKGTLFKGCGTPPYMSPEQLRDEPLTHLSDIFSMGILLYQMLTGQRPFQGEKNADIVSAILRDTPTPLAQRRPLPRELCALVEACLEKDPARRMDDLSKLRTAFAQTAAQLETQATQATQATQVTQATLPTHPQTPAEPTLPPNTGKKTRKTVWTFRLTLLMALLTLVFLGINFVIGNKLRAIRLYHQAVQLKQQQHFEEASSTLRNALHFDPKLVNAWLLLADCQSAQGFREKAWTSIQRAYAHIDQLKHKPAGTYRLQGRYYMHSLAYDQALQAFKDLEQLRPNDAEVKTKLHDCYAEMGRPEQAVEAIAAARNLDPDNFFYTGMHVLALLEDNRPETALEVLAHYRTTHPNHVYLNWGEGLAYLALDNVTRAETAFAALADDPEPIIRSWGQRLQALCLIYNGQFEVARQRLFDKVIEDNRRHSWENYLSGKLWLAHIHLLRGEQAVAINYLDDFSELPTSPTNLRAFRQLALLYLEVGRLPEAERLITGLGQIAEDYPSLHSRRALYHTQATQAMAEGKISAADHFFRKALENLPDPMLYWTYANHKQQQGQWQQAVDAYTKVIDDPGRVLGRHFPGFWIRSFFLRAQCFKQMNRHEEAMADYQHFLDFWGTSALSGSEVEAARRALTGG